MAAKKEARSKEPHSTGLNFFDKIAPMLGPLHDDGGDRDRADNRQLFYDLFRAVLRELPEWRRFVRRYRR